MSNAERMRRLRARQSAGKSVLRLEVDEAAIVLMLIANGSLAPEQEEDRAAVEAALTKQIEDLAALPRYA